MIFYNPFNISFAFVDLAAFFPASINPKTAPTTPPMICAKCEMLSVLKVPMNSFPIKMITIRINVIGISLFLILIIEVKIMSIKTIPLAPNKPLSKKIKFKIAVSNAVVSIMISSNLAPYCFSMTGPINKIKDKLPIK